MRFEFEGVFTRTHSSELLKELRSKHKNVSGVSVIYPQGIVTVDIEDTPENAKKTAELISKHLNAKRFREAKEQPAAPEEMIL